MLNIAFVYEFNFIFNTHKPYLFVTTKVVDSQKKLIIFIFMSTQNVNDTKVFFVGNKTWSKWDNDLWYADHNFGYLIPVATSVFYFRGRRHYTEWVR